MQTYSKVLNERFKLKQEIKAIQQENEELKSLLRKYMTSKVNSEMEVPPTRVILASLGLTNFGQIIPSS
jgi:dynein regulatory complex protein 1